MGPRVMGGRMLPWALTCAAAPLLAACGNGGEGRHASGSVDPDSAGVEVVQIPFPDPDEVERWRIDPEPTVVIGQGADGEAPYLFSALPALGRVPDGRTFALDVDSREVRLFGPEGTFEGTLGREGDGPGEFRAPVRWALPYRGDSLAVVETAGQARVSVFGPDGGFGRRFTVPHEPTRSEEHRSVGACCELVGALADGSWVARAPQEVPLQGPPERRGITPLLRVSKDGANVAELGRFEDWLWQERSDPDGPPVEGRNDRGYLSVAVAPKGEAIFVGHGAQRRIDVLDRDGHPVRFLRLNPLLDPAEANPGGSADDAEGPLPFRTFVADSEGLLWLFPPTDAVADDSRHPAAYVLDPAGDFVATVAVPDGVNLTEWERTWIGSDEIVTDAVGAHGTPRIAVHRLER